MIGHMENPGLICLIRRDAEPLPSLPNLVADSILLLIERLLVGARDVPVVELRHRVLLVADRVIFMMKLIGLLLRDLAFLQFIIDAAVLICEAVVNLIATRMIAFPLCLGKGGGDHATDHCKRNDQSDSFEYGSHDTLPFGFPFRFQPTKHSLGCRVSI